ncbi:hypothetical protein E1301_Tti013539 [Triplophysa tibetana]|uniref:Uncharacterized protein n=1 Tax=Triplophysa tibetana TaxID=1572043 RepID=A0A5A9NUF2_9TELE|nr:hypothetical protein E1301_Tti013539 [Triplophysa tibetana]
MRAALSHRRAADVSVKHAAANESIHARKHTHVFSLTNKGDAHLGSAPPPPFIKDDLDMMGCGVRYIKPSCREGGGGVVQAALERRTQPLTRWAESGQRIAGVMVPLSPFETGQDAEDSGKAVNHRSAPTRSRWFQVRPGFVKATQSLKSSSPQVPVEPFYIQINRQS